MRIILICLLGLAQGLTAAAVDAPASSADWALTRDLQQKAQGAPALPAVPGRQGDLLLAAADLSAGLAEGHAGDFKAGDYDALYSLLQRYRDELAGLGLDLQALLDRLHSAELNGQSLEERLGALLPVDGLKVHGRLRSAFEDFHLMGPLAIAIPAPSNHAEAVVRYADKPAGAGVRHQWGSLGAELRFELTRGLFSGLMEADIASLWGGGTEYNGRRIYGELRTPVAVQFGNIDVALSPLTLWRNEEAAPYEPEPFRQRRERLRQDYGLVADRWRVGGVRLSTDLRLFDRLTLQLDSISAVPALAAGDSSNQPVSFLYRFNRDPVASSNGDQLVVTNNSVMEGWRAGLLLGPVTLSWLGTLFTQVTESRTNNPYRPSTELVQGLRAELKAGPFTADAEGMVSAYVAPTLLTVAEARSLSGTALRVALGLQGGLGSLRLTGRAVSSGFHAAGAQGRTQDRNNQFLGPFPTEQTMIGADGRVGIDGASGPGGGSVMSAPQSRWNTMLIPPGVLIRRQQSSGLLVSAGTFGHLLPYQAMDSLSPYGDATPNRMGGGISGDLKLFGGALQPSASFDMAMEPEDTNDPALYASNDGNLSPAQVPTQGFTMQRARAGLDAHFKAGLPMALNGGYTWLDLRNGVASPILDAQGQPLPFAATLAQLEAGYQVWLSEPLSLQIGWRQQQGSGVAETQVLSKGAQSVYSQWAVGLCYLYSQELRFDALWENLSHDNPDALAEAFSLEDAYLRVTVNF